MRVHLNTEAPDIAVRTALYRAKMAGTVPWDVYPDVLTPVPSKSHQAAVNVHLATPVRPGDKRYIPPGVVSWAATYHVVSYFLAALFVAHPEAKAGPYKSPADFHAKTNGDYAARPVDLFSGR